MPTLRQLTKVLCIASFATLAATSAAASAVDDDFAAAMQDYDDGHYRIAYDRLAALADAGHADAARIALLMVRFGPQMYGDQWTASPSQIENWMRLASSKPANIVAAGGG